MVETRIVRLADVPISGKSHLSLRREQLERAHEARLGRAVGMRQFGVNHIVLEPGGISSLRHWHEGEDEFVHVLEGEITLIDENGAHLLHAGDSAGFPAGATNAHHLANRSGAPARFLAVGTRFVGRETIHYPDDPELGVATLVRDGNGERIPG